MGDSTVMFQGQVGPQTRSDGNSPSALRMGKNGEQICSDLHGSFWEHASRGNLFTSYVSAVATSVPATASIGNIVYNPLGSGVRLEMLGWASQIVATSVACTGIAIAGGYNGATVPTTTTAATAFGNTRVNAITRNGSSAGVLAYSIATVLTAPVVIQVLHHNTAAINTVGMAQISGLFFGGIVVEPGGFVALVALGAAAAASGHTSSLTWAEVPV